MNKSETALYEFERTKELLNKEGNLTKDEQLIFAIGVLHASDNSIKKEVINITDSNPNVDAVYVCVKENGFKGIIADSKKEILYVNKPMSYEEHLNRYLRGERTKIEVEKNKEEMKKDIDNLVNKIDSKIEELRKDGIDKLLSKEGTLTREEQIELGKLILNTNRKDELQIIDLKEKDPTLDAIYVCVKSRGGNSIIVNSNKEYLTATSSVDIDRHIQEFKNGRRTEK